MTVDVPDFDPELNGHAAVVVDGPNGEVCHAVVSHYEESAHGFKTECGVEVEDSQEQPPRSTIAERGVRMCPECWPESVVGEGESE